ncbi:MAG TPA: malto-oligosyltrehalose synthase [Gammaproteobacteria bacterium]|nr:malto-oligosyltrehalose synthase [Gammaproteobacteria bacterium]
MSGNYNADEILAQLAEICGIRPDYTDVWGKRRVVSDATKRALLADMGIPVEDEQQCVAALIERQANSWQHMLPPVQVTPETRSLMRIVIALPAKRPYGVLTWRLTTEDGHSHEGEIEPEALAVIEHKSLDGAEYQRCAFDIPLAISPGYHRLALDTEHGSASMALIVTPSTCYHPPALQGNRRAWGFSAQLYALKSEHNWGIGDFTDLKVLIDHAARLGADAVGVNPLHVLFPDTPAHRSPYSPSSRLFFNSLYLDVEEIAEQDADATIRQFIASPEFQRHLQALRDADLVDYPGVAAAKFPILERLFNHFCRHHIGSDNARAAAFRAFKEQGGEPLYCHALFEALHEHFMRQEPPLRGWSAWPTEFQNPSSEAVAAFAAEHGERIEFYQYLQWQVASQLQAVCEHARRAGLGIGIYQDLAVGINREGAEAWAHQRVYATGASIGAPPDLYNLKGQDWGLPPLIPTELTESAYALFIATLRNSMRYAQALRIDHVMGLMRLYWIPAGGKATTGAYVHYPLKDLLGILALESQRNQCLIIGEDLGTVPDEIPQALGPLGVLSYRVMYFEKRNDGGFKSPVEYPAQALAAVSTHDLPTLAGFWEGVDIAVRRGLDMFPSAELHEQQILERASDRARLLVALEQEDLLPGGMSLDPAHTPEMTTALAGAVHRFVARTPSQLMLVQLEDALGQREAVNIPATTDEYPNWQRKLSVSLREFDNHVLLHEVAAAVRAERAVDQRHAQGATEQPPILALPTSTYRLQFNHEFTFRQAAEIAPYLANLGVSHYYASPYLKARPGSMHGYDIIDHNALNPEIGSEDDYRHYIATLKQLGIGQVLDIVPNHVGVGSENVWWRDLLEHGQASAYADFFDVDWTPLKRELRGKVLLPVLGDHYGSVLERGELTLEFNAAQGAFNVRYFEHAFPVDPREYPRILQYNLPQLEAGIAADDLRLAEFKSLITAFEHLPERLETIPDKIEERARDARLHKARLAALCTEWPGLEAFITDNLHVFNGGKEGLARYALLHDLLERQAYRLAYWRVAADEINYRRFFDINDLAALRMEDERVFKATHERVLNMVERGELDGLRIDHPDGLYDPVQYYERLQGYAASARTAQGVALPARIYLIVEKILASHEHLPQNWPVAGTSGYDFTNLVNGLFIDPQGQKPLDRIYTRFIGHAIAFDDLLYTCKRRIMRLSLSSELNVLANRLSRICESDPRTRDFTQGSLRDALQEIVACFPVYRTYVTAQGASDQDRQYVDWAIAQAKKRSQAAETTIFDFIRAVLLVELPEYHAASRRSVAQFAMQFQQYTAPVMAKGFEDTALYNYNRLISLNEVGGDPMRFGISVSAFHHLMRERARFWPHSMLGTTTHDTKRSEDVRARINVLSEIPKDWEAHLLRWARINRSRKRRIDRQPAPDRIDEYLLYQTLVGSWPLEDQDADGHAHYVARIKDYMLKAAHEAKRRTSWTNPDQDYDQALVQFVEAILDNRGANLFLDDFIPVARRIARLGQYNSLAQCLLKFTAPGVPDIYQGNELWDFSLVDPDNRRPVDYAHRTRLLDEMTQQAGAFSEALAERAHSLLAAPEDGRIKMYLTWKLLKLRRDHPQLFRDGDYQALETRGRLATHLCAFVRSTQEEILIAVAPRLHIKITDGGLKLPVGDTWEDTWLQAPSAIRTEHYINALTGERVSVESGADRSWLRASQVLANLPVAALIKAV